MSQQTPKFNIKLTSSKPKDYSLEMRIHSYWCKNSFIYIPTHKINLCLRQGKKPKNINNYNYLKEYWKIAFEQHGAK